MEETQDRKTVTKTVMACNQCGKYRYHRLTIAELNGWIEYTHKCLTCGKTETVEYDDSRR